MPLKFEDLEDEPPSSIDPYAVLALESTASQDEVKSAYRKLALKHHPDKVSTEDQDAAKKRFQEIAFAYAILSDPRRRSRYDTTGRTEESLDLDDDDFNWTDYFREQWKEVVTADSVEKFKVEYQGSDEEKRDVLASYEKFRGNLNGMYEVIMLSNPLDDEERFREIIDTAIEDGEVQAYKAYTKESAGSKKRRMNEAKTEGLEAMEYAKKLGVADKLFGTKAKGGKKGEPDESALAALIQQRQKNRSNDFFDRLEAKYGGKKQSSGKKGTKRKAEDVDENEDGVEEPPEEAFARTAERAKVNKAANKDAKASSKGGNQASGKTKRTRKG